jgi:acid stress-induced BolA-like protein IbaG/YrbA
MSNRELKATIEKLLGDHFGARGLVDVSDGYGANVHVVVVSRLFDGKSDRERADELWAMLEPLTDDEKLRVSLIVPYSPAELK